MAVELVEHSEHLVPCLQGPDDETKQFLVDQGHVVCLRATCEGCKFIKECEHEPDITFANPVPPARKAIAYEPDQFLDIIPKEGVDIFTLYTKEELNNPFPKLAMSRTSPHWILGDIEAKFIIIQGQCRFFGTKEEFNESIYAKGFDIHNEYIPQHYVVAVDWAAIEPAVSTMASRERKWLDVFKGNPKPIFKEIIAKSDNADFTVDSNFVSDGRTFCFLKGELDKESFDDQCSKCKIKEKCHSFTHRDFYHNVRDDWHTLNMFSFWPKLKEEKNKVVLKEHRGKAKIAGLSLCLSGKTMVKVRKMI